LWVWFLMVEITIVAAIAIAVLTYLLHREQGLRRAEAREATEERALLLDRIQAPEAAAIRELPTSVLPALEVDPGPWASDSPPEKD